jgi:YHS domain-containing protein
MISNSILQSTIHNQKSSSMKNGGTMAQTMKDPVCGMDVDPKTAAGKSEYQGQTYYFCSPGCKLSFDKEPEKYVGKTQAHSGHH